MTVMSGQVVTKSVEGRAVTVTKKGMVVEVVAEEEGEEEVVGEEVVEKEGPAAGGGQAGLLLLLLACQFQAGGSRYRAAHSETPISSVTRSCTRYKANKF